MEKVKLTQDQADAIERLKRYHRDEIERFKRNPNHFADWLFPMKDMNVDNIEHAYREGYEVEPEFEVGDWITFDKKHGEPEVVKIEALAFRDYWKEECAHWNGGKYLPLTKIRHATPDEIAKEKERRWWGDHGREPWEMKRGDLILHDGDLLFVNKTDFDDYFALEASNYHLNTRLSEYHVRQCKVICFAEDRKDVDQ